MELAILVVIVLVKYEGLAVLCFLDRSLLLVCQLVISNPLVGIEGLSLCGPVNVLSAVCPESLNLVAVKHGLEEGIEDGLFTGVIAVTVICDNPCRSLTVEVSAPGILDFLDRRKHYETVIAEVCVDLVLVHIARKGTEPCTCPVSKCHFGSGLIVGEELLTSLLCSGFLGIGIDDAVLVALIQAGKSLNGSVFHEAVYPLAVLLIEGRISALPPFRHVVDVRSLIELAVACSDDAVGLAIGNALQKIVVVIESLDVFDLLAGLVKPGLLDVGNAAVAVGRSKAVLLAVARAKVFIDLRKSDAGLELGIVISLGQIPEHSGRLILAKHRSAHDQSVRILAVTGLTGRQGSGNRPCVIGVIELSDVKVDVVTELLADCLLPLLFEFLLAAVYGSGKSSINRDVEIRQIVGLAALFLGVFLAAVVSSVVPRARPAAGNQGCDHGAYEKNGN